MPLNADKAGENTPSGELALAVITESIREGATDVGGLQVNVTGPAGILTDLIAIFGAIDTALLGATALIVAIILIFVYRSPFIWVIPLLGSLMALTAASAIVYVLAKNEVLVLNGQSQGILTVLVFGAATDYALLTIARYREELHHHALHTDAIKAAWRGTVEPITASAATVIIGLMCLLLSELNSNRSLGPVGAAGILGALVVSLTFLPALLAIPSIVLPVLAFLIPTVIGLGLSLVSDIPVGPFAAVGGLLAVVDDPRLGRLRHHADPATRVGPVLAREVPARDAGRSGPRCRARTTSTSGSRACGPSSPAASAAAPARRGSSPPSSCSSSPGSPSP